MAHDFEPAERGLRDHLALWRRRAAVILGITAVAVLAAAVVTLVQTKSYQATAQVIVPVEPAGQPGQDPTQVHFDPNRVIQTEAVFATGDQVRSQVEARIGSGGVLSARGLKDSDVVQITGTAGDPQRAALLANTAAAVYVDLRQPPDGVRGVHLVAPATAPAAAANGSMARNLAVAIALGLVLGLLAAYTVDHLDDTVRDADDLERLTGLPVLGTVAGADGTGVHPVPLDDPTVARADTGRLVTVPGEEHGGDERGPAGGQLRVLLVPVRSRGHDVRDAVGVLAAVGVEVAAAVLLTSEGGADAGTPRAASRDAEQQASDARTAGEAVGRTQV